MIKAIRLNRKSISKSIERYLQKKKCCVCQKKRETSKQKHRRISNQAIAFVYIYKDIIIPFGSRACGYHLDAYGFLNDEALSLLNQYRDTTVLKEHDYTELLSLTRQEALKRTLFDRFENISTIQNHLCIQITGEYTSWRLGSFDLQEDENDDLSTSIYEIIKKIEEREWNEAKSIWTTKVNNMNQIINNDGCLSINTLGTEHEMFINSFVPFQEYQLKRKCSTSCERNNTIKIKKIYIYSS